MLSRSRAAFDPPFRPRLSRLAAPPNVSSSSKPLSGIRPRRPGSVVLAAVAAGAALWACADSVWEPPASGDPPAPAIAAVLSASPSADAPSLPPWLDAIRSMEVEGCVIHLRRADGSYASETYRLRYGRDALSDDGRWQALVYTVRGVVTRPIEGGGTETLPERLGVRAACLLPDTERGMEEARGRVEAILAERGIPGFDRAMADAGAGGSGWAAAWAALGRLAERLAPRPLAAAQRRCYTHPPFMFGVGCPAIPEPPPTNHVINVTCPAGFDFEYSSGNCVRTGFSPVPPTPSSPGTTPPGGGGTSPPSPPPVCTPDQIAIAAEYDDPVAWPCTTFTHSVTTGRGTHGHKNGYLTDSYTSGSGEVLSGVAAAGVSGAQVTSDWRCPEGNRIVGGTGVTHVDGRAGDFWAPGFLKKADGKGATTQEVEEARDLHAKFVTAAEAAGATNYTPFGYKGTHKDHIHIYW